MTLQAASPDLQRFRAAVAAQIGLQFDDSRLGFLAEVLQRRLSKLGCSSAAYLGELQNEASCGEIEALARELTVGETYFFRNIEQFRALSEIVLPERMAVARKPRTLRLLSAGCASGEEAYSLAIVARETILDPSLGVSIRAVDINPAALDRARRARFTPWALRETPAEAQRRWFVRDSREMALDPSLVSAVQFEVANIASEAPQLWQPDAYDVVFCRNVLMYFAPEQMRAVIARISRSLAPGGFLFLGHAETLRNVSDDFHLRHTHNTFYYERKEVLRRATMPARAPAASPAPLEAGPIGDDWYQAIGRATERVAALVPSPGADDAPPVLATGGWSTAPALELLRKERFVEALGLLDAAPSNARHDPDVLLLEAALLAHSGRFGAAEETCRRLLRSDELNAGAHYVLGLCREHRADREGAGEHYRIAAHLDPEFAMPRLHHGLIARRASLKEAARRELGQALVLLRREDASRLALFGGGFSREALIALCESALRDIGGQS